MFDETISPEIRHTFEDILSTYTVFMAQQGTPTVTKNSRFIFIQNQSCFLVW